MNLNVGITQSIPICYFYFGLTEKYYELGTVSILIKQEDC